MMVMYPPVRIGAGGELGFKAFVGLAIVQAGDALLPCLDLHQHRRQIPVRRRSAHHGNMWGALKNLVAFLLRHAAQDAKLLALLLKLFVIRQPVKDFLLRLIADRTSVVENQSSLFDGGYLAIALGHERANDFFRVMDIHLAAKGFQVERLLGIRAHLVQV